MSKILKPGHYIPIDDKKMIEAINVVFSTPVSVDGIGNELTDAVVDEIKQIQELKSQIIEEAEAIAQSRVEAADVEIAKMKDVAREEIGQWWSERRDHDEIVIEQARQQGFQQGLEEGMMLAENKVLEQYRQMLDEAKSIIEQAVTIKQQMIYESEPFLIDLSCAIAEKIVGKQLSLNSDWIVDLVKHVLARRREKGVITLCVSPANFSFMQNAREELVLSIDSQAELQILPDATVRDHGCVVRSAFGSIDARVDTQLQEIKKALRQFIGISGESVE